MDPRDSGDVSAPARGTRPTAAAARAALGLLWLHGALAQLALAILGVLVLVTDFLLSGIVAVVMSLLSLVLVGFLWYGVPLHARREAARAQAGSDIPEEG